MVVWAAHTSERLSLSLSSGVRAGGGWGRSSSRTRTRPPSGPTPDTTWGHPPVPAPGAPPVYSVPEFKAAGSACPGTTARQLNRNRRSIAWVSPHPNAAQRANTSRRPAAWR